MADIIRTTLGPRSMLKMLLDAGGGTLLLLITVFFFNLLCRSYKRGRLGLNFTPFERLSLYRFVVLFCCLSCSVSVSELAIHKPFITFKVYAS